MIAGLPTWLKDGSDVHMWINTGQYYSGMGNLKTMAANGKYRCIVEGQYHCRIIEF